MTHLCAEWRIRGYFSVVLSHARRGCTGTDLGHYGDRCLYYV